MVRTRFALVLGVGLIFGAAGTACKKDEKKADVAGDKGKGDSDKSADKPGVMPRNAVAASGDDLALLPLDSELVLGLNFGQIRQSALWQQFVAPKLASGSTNPGMVKFDKIKAQCGFDALGVMASITVGFKNIDGGSPTGVGVVHGPSHDQVWPCLDKMKDDIAEDGTQMTKDGDVALFKNPNKSNQSSGITFVNDTTMLIVVGEGVTADTVKAAASAKSTLKSSPPFLDMYSKVKTTDSVWGLMNGASKVFDKMSAIGAKPKAVFGSLNVSDGLAVDLRLRLESPDVATQFVSSMKTQMAGAKQMTDKAEVNAEGSDAHFEIAMSNQKLQGLIQQFGAMFGAFAGGMGGGGMGMGGTKSP